MRELGGHILDIHGLTEVAHALEEEVEDRGDIAER